MKVKDAAMQAYPFIEPQPDENIKAYHPGMELRDYFAAMAMQAMLSRSDKNGSEDAYAEMAYFMADAMLKARK